MIFPLVLISSLTHKMMFCETLVYLILFEFELISMIDYGFLFSIKEYREKTF